MTNFLKITALSFIVATLYALSLGFASTMPSQQSAVALLAVTQEP